MSQNHINIGILLVCLLHESLQDIQENVSCENCMNLIDFIYGFLASDLLFNYHFSVSLTLKVKCLINGGNADKNTL